LPAAQRRSITIEVYVSPIEYRALRRLAEPFPLSTFLRLQGLGRPISGDRIPPPSLQMIGQLQRIGNNLNQSVHLLHTGRLPPTFGEILRLLLSAVHAYHRALLGLPPDEPSDP
jgi:hypothetical protein